MPKEVDDRVEELMSKPDFKASYDKLVKTKEGLKKKFPTLESFAWARAYNERKKKAAEAGESGPSYLRLIAGLLAVDGEIAGLFTSERVKNLLDKGAPDRLNSALVITELTELEKPSSHKGPFQYILSGENAEEMWAELLNTPVHWTPFMSGHWVASAMPMIVGTVIDVAVDRRASHTKVLAAIQLWDKEWPEIGDLVRETLDVLGASYELSYMPQDSEEREEGTYVTKYHPTGMAILRRSRAAYPDMRVLAASADLDDADFEPEPTASGIEDGGAGNPETDSPGDGGQASPGAGDAGADVTAEVWATKYVNSLPDSSFALVRRPVKDKAKDRALPYKDKGGKVDAAHVRNALARLSQTQDWSQQEKARAKAKLQRALRGIGGKPSGGKGVSAMKLSPQLEALLAQCPDDETRDQMRAALEVQGAEHTAAAEASEVLAERDTKIGELSAQVTDLTSKVTTLESEKTEVERLQKVAEQKEAANKEFSDLVAKKVYAEEDKEKILPLIAKGLAGDTFSWEEAKLMASLKIDGEAQDLPGETPPSSSGKARLDDKEQDSLRDDAVKALEAAGITRAKKGDD